MRFQAPDSPNKKVALQRDKLKTYGDELEDKRVEKLVNNKRNQLRHHLFLGKEFRNYQQFKAMNQSKDKYGIGRATDSLQD